MPTINIQFADKSRIVGSIYWQANTISGELKGLVRQAIKGDPYHLGIYMVKHAGEPKVRRLIGMLDRSMKEGNTVWNRILVYLIDEDNNKIPVSLN